MTGLNVSRLLELALLLTPVGTLAGFLAGGRGRRTVLEFADEMEFCCLFQPRKSKRGFGFSALLIAPWH
jgi:hypothetical protein